MNFDNICSQSSGARYSIVPLCVVSLISRHKLYRRASQTVNVLEPRHSKYCTCVTAKANNENVAYGSQASGASQTSNVEIAGSISFTKRGMSIQCLIPLRGDDSLES